jgi:DNA-binding GntR family transcriptional regulator
MTPRHRSSRRRRRQLAHDHHAKILDALEKHDGTIYELAAATGLTHVQVARRMPELQTAERHASWPAKRAPARAVGQCRVWELAR